MTAVRKMFKREMNRIGRYITLGLLLVAWMVLLVRFAPGRILPATQLSSMIWTYLWIGCYHAPTCPLALWIAWGDAPLVSRVPWGLGVTILLGLTASLGFAMNGVSDQGIPVFQVLSLCVETLLLLPARKRLGWRIRIPGKPSPKSNQFGIGSLLVLTAGAACLLGLANQLVDDWERVTRNLFSIPPLRVGIVVAIQSLAVVWMGVPATGTILASWPRRRFAKWLLIAPLLFVLAYCGFMLFEMAGLRGRYGINKWFPLAMPPLLVAGFLTSLCATLLVLRRCGYRLTSPDWQEMPVETEIPFAAAPPAGEEK